MKVEVIQIFYFSLIHSLDIFYCGAVLFNNMEAMQLQAVYTTQHIHVQTAKLSKNMLYLNSY